MLCVSRWIEAKPHFGIVASFAGFGASLFAVVKDLSVVLSFGGAVFGFLAGYYTWRVKREHWLRVRTTLAPAKEIHKAAVAAAKKVYTDAVALMKEE